jgi:hypothetical protein
MNRPALTKEIAYNAIQDFFNDKPFVLFGTGTSCAVDLNFGMGALEEHLKQSIPNNEKLSVQQKDAWQRVVNSLTNNSDFEAAMNSIQDEILLKEVIRETATHVAEVDRANSEKILNGSQSWSAIQLFKRLIDGLPEMDRTLHVATPNYDLLAEYAFAQAGIPYSTGFWGGVMRKLDWYQAERQITYIDKVPAGRKIQNITRLKKHIRLYKVHGSLNTFCIDGQCIETDLWIRECPEDIKRLIITPGSSKYERLHENRDTLLSEYDKAVRHHRSFLFLGFGFNDKQLVENEIGKKLEAQSPALVITRDWNQRIQDILENSTNTWLICKHQDNESTRIFNRKYQNWLELPDKQLWCFDQFATEIMGN